MSKTMSAAAIQKALIRLADPEVNSQIYFASTVTVAKDIIRSLPGVRRLRREGSEVAQTLLALLPRQRQTQENENFLAIGLHILEAYPSNDVKLALARPIVERRFRGINSFLAAETFLKAAGIEAVGKDVLRIALREAKKVVAYNFPKMKAQEKQPATVGVKTYRSKPLTAKK